ncbi:MAG TPA: hypothetical protein VGE63_03410 [Candidatus Paceibacterota bacterium]
MIQTLLFVTLVILLLAFIYWYLIVEIKKYFIRQQVNLLEAQDSFIGLTPEYINHLRFQEDKALGILVNKKKMLLLLIFIAVVLLSLAAFIALPLVVDDAFKVINLISKSIYWSICASNILAFSAIYDYHIRNFPRYMKEGEVKYNEMLEKAEQAKKQVSMESLFGKPSKNEDEDLAEF